MWASSETVLGLPFDTPPAFAPIDETIEPRPESSYALSKLAGETLATQFNRRTGIPIVGLRISNIMEPDDYARFPSYWDDATLRKWNLWGYVDCRDVAQACRLGLEADVTGAEVCIVAADDTVMTRPSADLMAEVFPDVPLTREVKGRETLLSIERARRILGYHPEHRWADHVAPGLSPTVTPTVEVKDNPAENRYEAWVDGALAGFSEYEPKDGWLVFTHTEVKPEYEGQGVGSKLAKDGPRRRPGARPQAHAAVPVHQLVDQAPPGVCGPRGRDPWDRRSAARGRPARPVGRPRAALGPQRASVRSMRVSGTIQISATNT